MMTQPVVSRSQRRIERKQLVLVVILILAVAGVSFSLGVMFGRQGGVASGGPDGTTGSGTPEIARIEPPPKPAEEVAAEKPEQLTFYDNLPKGKQAPLGSGINLPPEPKAKSSGSVAAISLESSPAR